MDLQAAVAKKEAWMLARLKELVNVESPSDEKAAVDEAVTLVAQWCTELDGRVKRHKQKRHGDLLEVRFGPVRSKRKPVMLLGHLDTVWPRGTLKQMPFRVADGRVWGPGTLDMKAGVVMMLAALAVLQEEAPLEQPVVVLLHSDEEIGSPVSRALTEKVAKTCAAVFVLEPAQGLAGAYKTARKGVGDYHLRVKGVAAHSGVDFTSGHSAVLELARLLGKVSTFTDLKRGITVNPGVIGGGTRSNVIAAEAWADVDVRIAKAADAARVEKLFRKLKCEDKHCSLEVTGGVNRPPMERKPGTVKLFRQAQKLAKEMGIALEEAATGGGSDGNFTAGLGIPTLDGMGVVGEGAHARHESFLVEQLVPRTALLAGMLLRVE
ncbi:MAG: M20 family metallopeptidase [Acidobacteriaceae bacterium]